MRTLRSNPPLLILGVSLILGLLFDYFFYGKIPGLGFPLYILLITIALFAISTYLNKQVNKQVIWLLTPLMFFSAMVFVRSSGFLTFLNIVASIILLLIIAKITFEMDFKNFLLGDYIKTLFLPFGFIRPSIQTLSNIFRHQGDGGRNVLLKIVKSVIILLPILFIFLLLFSAADLFFKDILSNLINMNIDIWQKDVPRILLITFVTFVFVGAYSYIFRGTENTMFPQQNYKLYNTGNIENFIILGSVNVLFFIFIIVQLSYFFGGGGNVSPHGFTYAEYARKGFFELIVVAIISFLLLWAVDKHTTKRDAKHFLPFKILSGVLIVQVIIIIASAFKRLMLYEEAYGFTTSRLYGHVFIVLLFTIFILLFYKIFKDGKEKTFAFHVFITTIVFLATINLLNPDAFVAHLNIKRFTTTGKIDLYYLCNNLSDDAISEIESIKLLNMTDDNLQETFVYALNIRARHKINTSNWQSLNIARINAEKIMNSAGFPTHSGSRYEIDFNGDGSSLLKELRPNEFFELISDYRIEHIDWVALYFPSVDHGISINSDSRGLPSSISKLDAIAKTIKQTDSLFREADMAATIDAILDATEKNNYLIHGMRFRMNPKFIATWRKEHDNIIKSIKSLNFPFEKIQ